MEKPRTTHTVWRLLSSEDARFLRETNRAPSLALTVAFALPLALFLFVLVQQRRGAPFRACAPQKRGRRRRPTAASLWHARFLNYCAYTRRHIVANFATIALCTCYVNSDKMYKHIYDAENLTPHGQPTTAIPGRRHRSRTRMLADAHRPVRRHSPWSRSSAEGCDVMNGWLSKSQQAMYLAVGGRRRAGHHEDRGRRRLGQAGTPTSNST